MNPGFRNVFSTLLFGDGEPVAAVEEKRFRRVKHWAGFPPEPIRRSLEISFSLKALSGNLTHFCSKHFWG
jgi:predicted NodU family carbamoyl transferase